MGRAFCAAGADTDARSPRPKVNGIGPTDLELVCTTYWCGGMRLSQRSN